MPKLLTATRKKERQSIGTRLAAGLRAECNGLSRSERAVARERARSVIGGAPVEVRDPATGRVRVIRVFQPRTGGNFAKHAARFAGIVKDGPPDLSTRRPFE